MGMDIYGRTPSTEEGEYFSANIFTWPVILSVAKMSILVANLSMDTEGWDYNDGKGLQTQDECNALADAMEVVLRGTESSILGAEHLEATKAISKLFGGIEPQAQAHRDRIFHFITFLRGCGGFIIC